MLKNITITIIIITTSKIKLFLKTGLLTGCRKKVEIVLKFLGNCAGQEIEVAIYRLVPNFFETGIVTTSTVFDCIYIDTVNKWSPTFGSKIDTFI